MRFDQFIEQSGIAVSPVDSIDGFIVDVGLPSEWAPLDSVHGVRVWIWRCDPHITEFCANAVLTMHCIDAPLEAGEMFAMLSEQQAHMLSGSRIEQNELGAAKEGPGFTGTFAMIFASPFGPIGSVSRSRIITADRRTLVAQLTITAMQDSPVDRTNIWLSVTPGASGDSVSRYCNEGSFRASSDGH